MTCKVNGLFSIGEDFDDEDLLGTDWLAPPSFVPGSGPLPPSSGARQVSAVAPGAQDKGSLPGHLPNGAGSGGRAEAAAGRIATSGLRQISSTSVRRLSLPTSSCPAQPPAINTARPGVALQRSHATREPPQRSFLGEDGFDDWDVDVDLAGLDESDPYTGVGVHNPHTCRAPSPLSTAVCTEGTISSANKLRYPTSRIQTVTGAAPQTRGLSCRNLAFPPQPPPSLPVASPEFRPRFVPAPSQSTGFVSGFTASPNSIRFPRPLRGSHQALRPWATPGPSPLVRSLFEATSPLASSASPPGFTPRPIHTPVLTNRLVQLVSASNKPLVKRPRCGHRQPKTRRFPGPAGLLPQQPLNQSLDDIVVSVPQTPAHGAVARLPSQCASSQISEEEDFSSGPWAAMKTEMGLDERNLSCFLHSYSVVMVLRKAALKQLVKNKVPNMAVQLKSILHTHADAKAVFKDPTGEIQGTVHRRLLEDRQGELKAGAVLLLKQVGVFSPSHRNHYLNVTSSNLLRIYPPDGASLSSTADLPKLQLKPVSLSTTRSAAIPGGHVSAMQLVFDDDDEEEEEEEEMREESPRVRADRRTSLEEPPPRTYNTTAPEDPAWDADDGLNELLGELLEEHHGL